MLSITSSGSLAPTSALGVVRLSSVPKPTITKEMAHNHQRNDPQSPKKGPTITKERPCAAQQIESIRGLPCGDAVTAGLEDRLIGSSSLSTMTVTSMLSTSMRVDAPMLSALNSDPRT